MTTNPSPPQGSEEFDLEQIERELKEISPWPWIASVYRDEWYLDGPPIINYDGCHGEADTKFIAKSPQRLAAAVKRIRELENIINEMDKLNKESKVIIENILKSSDE